jgi:hypothetical protein
VRRASRRRGSSNAFSKSSSTWLVPAAISIAAPTAHFQNGAGGTVEIRTRQSRDPASAVFRYTRASVLPALVRSSETNEREKSRQRNGNDDRPTYAHARTHARTRAKNLSGRATVTPHRLVSLSSGWKEKKKCESMTTIDPTRFRTRRTHHHRLHSSPVLTSANLSV